PERNFDAACLPLNGRLPIPRICSAAINFSHGGLHPFRQRSSQRGNVHPSLRGRAKSYTCAIASRSLMQLNAPHEDNSPPESCWPRTTFRCRILAAASQHPKSFDHGQAYVLGRRNGHILVRRSQSVNRARDRIPRSMACDVADKSVSRAGKNHSSTYEQSSRSRLSSSRKRLQFFVAGFARCHTKCGQTADSGCRQRHRNRATDPGFIGKVGAISCARGERSRQSVPERTNIQTAPDPARHCPNPKPRHCNRRAIPRRPGPAQNSHSLFAGVDQPLRGSAPHSRTRVSFKSRRSRGVARRDPEISSCSTAALKTKRNAAWRNPHLSEERSKIDPSEALQIPTDAPEPGTARAASL